MMMGHGNGFLAAGISLLVPLLLVFSLGAGGAEEKYDGVFGRGSCAFALATGSPGELGLLQALAEAFAQESDAKLLWRKAGSGEALKLLKEKKVDAIMVHDPEGEKKAIQEGWAVRHTLIGSNEFYIVGPASDPADIRSAKTAAEAYQRIAARRAPFYSRGDNSGTHKKEMSIWKKANMDPQGDWYIVTGGFMKATLQRANEEEGYFMTDSSTWIMEKGNLPRLRVLFRGEKILVNTYHALCQPEGSTPGAHTAAQFITFVASEKGQDIIRSYGREEYGEALYNDAAYAQQYE